MNAHSLADAITMLDEKILFNVLEERHRRYTQDKRMSQRAKVFRRFSVAAAIIGVVCIYAIILIIPLINNQAPTGNALNIPQYVGAFSSPELAELYMTEPYSDILPQVIPEGFAFISSYKTEYDPIANPNNVPYLLLIFEAEECNLEVKVMVYDGTGALTDSTDPSTYDLSLYYDYIENTGGVPADAPKTSDVLFRHEDITEEIAQKRMYLFQDGLCKAEIQILCGDYVVAYCYSGIELSQSLFYEVITSPRLFDGEQNIS